MQNDASWAESGQQIYFVLLKEHLGKMGATIKHWTLAYKHLDFWSVLKTEVAGDVGPGFPLGHRLLE